MNALKKFYAKLCEFFSWLGLGLFALALFGGGLAAILLPIAIFVAIAAMAAGVFYGVFEWVVHLIRMMH